MSATTAKMMTKMIRRRGRCSGCKSRYHDIRTCHDIDIFGWCAGFITEKEKKLNDENLEQKKWNCDYTRNRFEIQSAITLQHIERNIRNYIIPYTSQKGNPPLRSVMACDRHHTTNELWIDHMHTLNKNSERRLFKGYGEHYYRSIKWYNTFVDKLNFTIKKSKKFEKDTLHNVNAVSKKHHLPLEICNNIAEYIYKCPYEDGEEILYYEI